MKANRELAPSGPDAANKPPANATETMRAEIAIYPSAKAGVAIAIDGVLNDAYSQDTEKTMEQVVRLKDKGYRFRLVLMDPKRAHPAHRGRARRWRGTAAHFAIPYRLVGRVRRLDAAEFRRLSGMEWRTNKDARAAGMMLLAGDELKTETK